MKRILVWRRAVEKIENVLGKGLSIGNAILPRKYVYLVDPIHTAYCSVICYLEDPKSKFSLKPLVLFILVMVAASALLAWKGYGVLSLIPSSISMLYLGVISGWQYWKRIKFTTNKKNNLTYEVKNEKRQSASEYYEDLMRDASIEVLHDFKPNERKWTIFSKMADSILNESIRVHKEESEAYKLVFDRYSYARLGYILDRCILNANFFSGGTYQCNFLKAWTDLSLDAANSAAILGLQGPLFGWDCENKRFRVFIDQILLAGYPDLANAFISAFNSELYIGTRGVLNLYSCLNVLAKLDQLTLNEMT